MHDYGSPRQSTTHMKINANSVVVQVDPHFPPSFYAHLWGLSESTVLRWFQDRDDVLKLSVPGKNGKRTRVEIRIPFSVAIKVYHEHCQSA
jgi:hypothetical protein